MVALNWHNCGVNGSWLKTYGGNMIRRRRSKLHGWGVFADERINKNKRIIDYAGEKISHQESLRRERRYMKKGTIWCFQINRRWVRDAAVGGNVARFINHSCHPNCYVHIVRRHDLDPRGAQHPQRRGADLRLHDRRRGAHPVPLPDGLSAAVVGLRAQGSGSRFSARAVSDQITSRLFFNWCSSSTRCSVALGCARANRSTDRGSTDSSRRP